MDEAVGSTALVSSCSSSASAENDRLRLVPETSVWTLRVVVDVVVVVCAEMDWDVEGAAAVVSGCGTDGWSVASGDVVDGCSSPARTAEV
jgi:hypothetical protein